MRISNVVMVCQNIYQLVYSKKEKKVSLQKEFDDLIKNQIKS